MIMMGTQNKFGNVIHLIVGPETEVLMDVHGSVVMDITPILKAMPQTDKVLVNVSKCRTEPLTSQMLNSMGVPHMCTTMNVTASVGPETRQPQTTKSENKAAVCTLCGTPTQYSVPGIKLCDMCILIELGLKDKANRDQKGTV